jgi:hypothetical protein
MKPKGYHHGPSVNDIAILRAWQKRVALDTSRDRNAAKRERRTALPKGPLETIRRPRMRALVRSSIRRARRAATRARLQARGGQ